MHERILGIGLSQHDIDLIRSAYAEAEFTAVDTIAEARESLDQHPRPHIVILDIEKDLDGLISLYHTMMFQTENQQIIFLILGSAERVASALDGSKPDPLALLKQPLTSEHLKEQIAKNREAKSQVSESVLLAEQGKVVNILFAQAPLAMLLRFEDGQGKQSLYANEALQKLLGVTDREVKARGFESFVQSSDQKNQEQLLLKLTAGQINSYTLDVRLIAQDGSEYAVTEDTKNLKLPNNRVFATLSIFS